MQRIFLLLICLILFTSLNAQYEDVWAFGISAGLDFRNGTPVPIKTSILAPEGSASVCDEKGQLLFYTNGQSIWNRDHNVMPQGADIPQQGNAITLSTSQGALIVPLPASRDKYLVFSLSSFEYQMYSEPGGLYYSLVDMSLNNGLGDVAMKGKLMDTFLTEHMTAVAGDHCDTWLLLLSRWDATLRAFHIDHNGINMLPVLSPVVDDLYNRTGIVGTMNVSPYRNKMAIYRGKNLVVYKLDPATGKITEPLVLDSTAVLGYGNCFSPGNTKLYASNSVGIFQYDLSLNDVSKIIQSKVKLADVSYCTIKNGPDGRIYVADYQNTSLDVINLPDLPGLSCNYVSAGLRLLPGTSGSLGLPNTIAKKIVPTITKFRSDTVKCFVATHVLKANDLSGYNYKWDNDGTGADRQVDSSGIYAVSYYDTNCAYHVDSFAVWFPAYQLPGVMLSGSCVGDRSGKAWMVRQAGDTSTYNLTWKDAQKQVLSVNDTLSGVPSGIYTLRITTITGCDTLLSIVVPEYDFKASFKADSLACSGKPVVFENTSDTDFVQMHWDFGDETFSAQPNPAHTYSSEGTYTVSLSVTGKICRDTFSKIIVIDEPLKDLSIIKDKENICKGEAITFMVETAGNFSSLLWRYGDGVTNAVTDMMTTHAYEESGKMQVELLALFRVCPDLVSYDSLYVHAFPVVNLVPADSTICLKGTSIILSNHAVREPYDYRYLWSTGETTEHITVHYPGEYQLTVTVGQDCATTESIIVSEDCYIHIPNAFTPNGDGENEYFFPRQLLSRAVSQFRMKIWNRWGQLLFETETINGRGWDGRFNGKEQAAGVYVYVIDLMVNGAASERYEGNVILIR